METKMKKFGRRKVSIPDEIMFEIFSWLPIQSLMRFKCASGFCNSLVSESHFSDIHRCHSMTRPGTNFFLHERKGFYSVEQEKGGNMSASLFQPERFIESINKSRMNCANGLFCIWQPSIVRSAVIFNPGTREVRSLLLPNKAFDVKSENFEIITLWNESTWFYYYHLIEVKGKLAVVDCHMVSNSFDLWILEHSLERKWKRCVIQFPSNWNYKVPRPISSCMSRDGNIVLIRNEKHKEMEKNRNQGAS
ncbi:putative F-box protein At1g47790 [Solanum verrucosum]|uniref:putative F-box protein At1g47790 n=1 Tax=Solanum verrucosum TaxID=315347 RepID=UPI0020D0A932|nr:putative F-box protein At1g47790 [Solanum verrucosum]